MCIRVRRAMYLNNLLKHPLFTGEKRNLVLNPFQKGILKLRDGDRKKEAGDRAEALVTELLRTRGYLAENIYFETGEYNARMKLYSSTEIDRIFIDGCIICLEVKSFKDGDYRWLKINKNRKNWRIIKTNGKKQSKHSGVDQNEGHGLFLEALFELEGFYFPIYRVVVICGLSPEQIVVEGAYYNKGYELDNMTFVVTLEDLCDCIEKIKARQRGNFSSLDTDNARRIVNKYGRKDKFIQYTHLYEMRNMGKKNRPISKEANLDLTYYREKQNEAII